MRDWSISPIGIAVLACLGVAVGCKYDPHPADGTLRCSALGECPEGYSCQTSFCFSNSAPSRDAGLGGDAIPPAARSRYIGDWTLSTTSTVDTQCDDGFVDTSFLSPTDSPSVMTITAGTPGMSDLNSTWLCDLYLRLDSAGAHLFDGNPTCSDDTGEPVNTWTAIRFDVVANNATTATHSALYGRVDQYADTTVVNCTQTVRASLTKN